MTDTFEQQLAEIEAANAGEPDQLEPGAGEQPKKTEEEAKPSDQETDDESGASDDPLELTDEDEAVEVDDDEEGGEEDEGEDGKRRRSKPAKQRIAELTAKQRDAERRAEAAEAELAKLRGGEEAKELVKPNPEDFEYGEADPKYIDAVTDYKLESREAERTKGEKQQRQQTLMMERLNAGLTKAEAVGQEKYEDFDEKITAAAAARSEPLPPILSIGLAVSPVGGDIIYRLATDEAASARLETLAKGQSPKALAMALGELEGEYIDGSDDSDLDINDEMDMARMMGRMRARSSGKKAPEPKTVEIVPTNAPEPPAKRAKGGSGKASVKPDTDDINAFMREFGKDLGR